MKHASKHFVLVHSACHGAWAWFKLKHRLESAGHRVTVLDLAASGTNPRPIHEVYTFKEYTQPLLDFLHAAVPPAETVVLVGHSFGGLSLALASDMFADKVSVAVFLSAFVPDTTHGPSYVLDRATKEMLDTQFRPYQNGEKRGTSIFFGPMFLSSKLYQLSPVEDLELGKILVRPGSLFMDDLSRQQKLSEEGYGSVTRVCIVCSEDEVIPKDFQRWMIQNSGIKYVFEIGGADHMAMFSKPQELCECLLGIANRYA
ncbi:hypothetical protein CRG98_013602 [Punica granatum]|uniref:AB hydrolase-1 domain-containing protein n=1 Tax=Punica granatum TaxID=22663 RepID=A0A2I0KBX6_PUNGR|nr:hypothetical protein CRG98_013602 [Punica granatum]